MLIWLIFAVITAAVLAAVLGPLLRSSPALVRDEAEPNAIYRDQLSEIAAEVERGQIGVSEAAAARIEVARRLLDAADIEAKDRAERVGVGGAGTGSLRVVALLTAIVLPLSAVGIYLSTGRPSLPDQPFAARKSAPPGRQDVAMMIRAVEERLRQRPDDGDGWDVIAPVYFAQGRHADAADAFRRALRLKGESARRLGGFAESLVLAADGTVGAEARAAFERLVVLDPERLEPRFMLAIAKEQDGRRSEALADLKALLARARPDADWRPMLAERIAMLEASLAESAIAAPRGPGADDIAAAAQLPEAERRQMIEAMVAGLDRRLAADGRDLQGWQRLVRAYVVLGRKDDAVSALARARTALAAEPAALTTLGELAQSLGLGS